MWVAFIERVTRKTTTKLTSSRCGIIHSWHELRNTTHVCSTDHHWKTSVGDVLLKLLSIEYSSFQNPTIMCVRKIIHRCVATQELFGKFHSTDGRSHITSRWLSLVWRFLGNAGFMLCRLMQAKRKWQYWICLKIKQMEISWKFRGI